MSPSPRLRALRALSALLLIALAPLEATAAPLLRCELSQADHTLRVDTAPAIDPYRVESVDIGSDFRFKAVMIGDETGIAYIKLYTYQRHAGRSSLLHQASFIAPARPAADAPVALGGVQTLYAPGLGRALEYRCTLIEVAA